MTNGPDASLERGDEATRADAPLGASAPVRALDTTSAPDAATVAVTDPILLSSARAREPQARGEAMNTISGYAQGDGSNAVEQREGPVARAIEKQTAKLPSDVFLWAAGAAMIGSLAFQVFGPRPKASFFGRPVEGRAPLAGFIGQWVPTLLLFGIYNKIVKVGGSDRISP